ncbi:MAG: helix-turn-helix domain-containing protein [Gammaproteobacteria bacterium]|nr:helix-turn-helix domain-containing protein [Gammaproteobacteria bacterium]MDE0364789.1 helix-turn-helix domain-containing protein [Gammaproteobacteria bacterium]
MTSYLLEGCYRKGTSGLDEKDRIDYWRDIICDEFVKLDCGKMASNFRGELRGGASVGDLQFAEVVADPQFVERSKRQIAKFAESDFLISFQLEERGLVRQNGREALLTPGSFALYDSTQPYSLTFEQRFHQLVVQMPKEVLSRHLMNPEQYTAVPISGKSGLGAVLTDFIFSLARELHHVHTAPDELSENLVDMIAIAFSSSVMLNQVGNHSIVRESLKRRIRQYIDNNLCNPDLSNLRIAAAQNISVRYLHKLFDDEEETVHAIILNKRLERARGLLNDRAYAGHSIERIAYSTGFVSAAHFSRAFKKRYGVCPSDVR